MTQTNPLTDEQIGALEAALAKATKMRALSPVAVGKDDPETVGRIAGPLCTEIASLRTLAGEALAAIRSLREGAGDGE